MKPRLFQLIDLDRTLFDTARFVKAIIDEIEEIEPGFGAHLSEQFEQSYKNEETFFLLRYLRQEKGDDWFASVVRSAMEKHGKEAFILPGVAERLRFAEHLTTYRPAWGILTYGDEIDQRMKAALIGLDHIPMYLVDTPDKSQVIRSWLLTDGTFHLPSVFGGEIVDALTLEDDKLRAFNDLPPSVCGIWLSRGATVNKHTSGLIVAKNLKDSAAFLQEKYQ